MNENRIANTIANLEPIACNEPVGAQEGQRFDTPVCIHIHSVRKRLADSDGISGKAAIDGLVKAGILKDDTTEFVKEVRFSQEKGSIEKTIISIVAQKTQKHGTLAS